MPLISLLFDPAARPAVSAIHTLAASSGQFSVSLDPGDKSVNFEDDLPDSPGKARWAELLVNGLTFDIVGLAPGAPSAVPPLAYRFDLPVSFGAAGVEAIAFSAGPHLAAGQMMMPVVRSLTWLVTVLCKLPGLKAVAWHPARSWCSPEYFARTINRWLEGGVFPALCLTSLSQAENGAMVSEGLNFFTGQELTIDSAIICDQADAARLAVRLLHLLAEQGRLAEPVELLGPTGEPLALVPSADGRMVMARGAG